MAEWGLWERCGLELEYMIVDQNSLQVQPLADYLLRDSAGEPCSDLERGPVGWSNELVRHVIEFKCADPVPNFIGWSARFGSEINFANELLRSQGAMLLPTAAHPFMDPATETHLWTLDNRDIYAAYDRIFNCQGHGWSNLQSTHLNLSFNGDSEFGILHAAIRILLPLIPALAASSPYLDGCYTGFKDARLETYRHNQKRIPSIAGKIIPEAVFTRADYERVIFDQVRADIAPHDPEHILNHHFLNSRGAIARFDRGAIEIRLVDIQECPLVDVSIAETQIALLQGLVSGRWGDPLQQRTFDTDKLAQLLMNVIRNAEHAVIEWPEYLRLFAYPGDRCTAHELWQHIAQQLSNQLTPSTTHVLDSLLKRGTLASVLVNHLGKHPTRGEFIQTYNQLAACLATNQMFNV